MKGWFDCSRTDGEVVKARHTGKGTKILHENDDKTKGIISYQYDVYSRRKEGANKKQEMMDSFLDSFVEDKNGTLYKVKFTNSRRGNAYTIHSTDEVVVLDGYGDGATKSTVTNKEQDKVVVKKENDGDDVMETEKSAGDEGKEVAAVSSSKSEADSMPPAGLDLLAEAVESRENGDANEKSGDYDSDATIALVSSSSSEETEEERLAAAGLDALLSGKNGKNRRKQKEVETAPVAEGKGDKAEEFILDESTKQDANAYIETCKEGRSALFDKATASIQDDQLQDKKEKLEKDLASTKHDMSLVTSGVFKQYGEQTLLDTTQQLKEVDAQLDAEQEQIRNKKESIQGGKNEEERDVAAKPLKKRKIESSSGKGVDGILVENTKQDVNAYIETVKKGRSELFDKATAGMKNSKLLDKKEKLEKECSSLKLDLSLVTSERFKQYGEQKLLDTNRELKKVEIELLAEDEKMRGTKQAIQAIIMKALGEDDAMH